MSHWNYRIMLHETGDFGVFYTINEVYYDDDGKTTGWTQQDARMQSHYDNRDDDETLSDEMMREKLLDIHTMYLKA